MASSHINCVTFSMLETVRRQLHKQISLHGEQFKWWKRKWRDVELKVEYLDSELTASKKDMKMLKFALHLEREKRREAEQNAEKLKGDVEELRTECVRLEGKLIELEERPPPQAPTPQEGFLDEMMNMLKELMNSHQSKFDEWNGRQEKLEREVDVTKEMLNRLTVVLPPPTPTPPAAPLIPKEEAVSFISTVPFTRPPSACISTQVPSPLAPDINLIQFLEEELSPRNVPQPGIVPVQMPRPMVAQPFTAEINLQHGEDATDPSGLKCMCGTFFPDKNSFTSHVKNFIRDRNQKIACLFCKNKFGTNSLLRGHMSAYHNFNPALVGDDGSVGCGKCDEILRSRAQYLSHFKSHHPSTNASSSGNDKAPIPISKKRLAEPEQAQSAVPKKAKVTKRKNQSNPSKARQGPTRNAYVRHGMDHARNLHCLCGQNFENEKKLKRHLHYYAKKESNNVFCRICSKTFASNCYLKYHMARAHKNPTQVKVEVEVEEQRYDSDDYDDDQRNFDYELKHE